MSKRKATHLVAAYYNTEDVEPLDRLTRVLYRSDLLPKENRSELVRFALQFLKDFMDRHPNLEYLNTAKDYLLMEGTIEVDSLGTLASLSSELLTNQIIDNFGKESVPT